MSSDWFKRLFIDEAKAALESTSSGNGGSSTFSKTATVTTDWIGTEAPYTQTVSVPGVLSTDRPHVTPIYSTDISTAKVQEEEWSKISDIESNDGSIVLECFKECPTVGFDIQIEINR